MSDYFTAEEGSSSGKSDYFSAESGVKDNSPGTPSISPTKRIVDNSPGTPSLSPTKLSGEKTSSLPENRSEPLINLEEINLEEINLEEKEPDLEDLYDFFCDSKYQNRGIVKLQDVQEAQTYLSPDQNILLYRAENGDLKYKSNSISAAQCPGYFQYNGIPLNIVEYISSGSYGYVIRLSSETELPSGYYEITGQNNKVFYSMSQLYNPKAEILSERPRRPQDTFYSVVIKVFKKEGDSEIGNIRWLEGSNTTNLCNTINIILKTTKNPHLGKESVVALMDTMDGNLFDYAEKLPSLLELNPHVGENTLGVNPFHLMEVIVDITRKLADSLYCLKSYKIGYSDLKAENILFKCSGGEMIVSLGDIGSLCKITGSAACTYPPCDFTMEENHPGLCSESSMVWGLGIIFLQLLQYPHKRKILSPSKKLFSFEGLKEIFYHGNYKRNVVMGEKYYGIVFEELKKVVHNYKLSSYIVQIGADKYKLSHILKIMFDKKSKDRMGKLRYLKDMYLVDYEK